MNPEDLRLGDIIFYNCNALSQPPTHVAMYTGDINGIPHVTHCVLNATPGVQTTVLKEMEPNGPIHVFRSKDEQLGIEAAKVMLEWAKYRIPYDTRRANWMIEMSKVTRREARRVDKMEEVDYLLEQYIGIAKGNIWEGVKFAARRGVCPVRFTEGLQARGFTCVQAVILAYKVAQLKPYVIPFDVMFARNAARSETVEQIKEFWISDKYFSIEGFEEFNMPESFKLHSESLRDKEEYPDFCFYDKRFAQPHKNFFPSIVSLTIDMPVDEFIEWFPSISVMNLPAKFCFTDALYAYLCKFDSSWENMGTLNKSLLATSFSPEAKMAHKKRSEEFSAKVMLEQKKALYERELGTLGPTSEMDSDGNQEPRQDNSPRARRLMLQ